jgi:hypothetical protein
MTYLDKYTLINIIPTILYKISLKVKSRYYFDYFNKVEFLFWEFKCWESYYLDILLGLLLVLFYLLLGLFLRSLVFLLGGWLLCLGVLF